MTLQFLPRLARLTLDIGRSTCHAEGVERVHTCRAESAREFAKNHDASTLVKSVIMMMTMVALLMGFFVGRVLAFSPFPRDLVTMTITFPSRTFLSVAVEKESASTIRECA